MTPLSHWRERRRRIRAARWRDSQIRQAMQARLRDESERTSR